MLPTDYEYVEGMKLKRDELLAEICGQERIVEHIYERGEIYPGEISQSLSDLDLLRGQAYFAEVVVSLLDTGKLPERPKPVLLNPHAGGITDLMIERARGGAIENLFGVKHGTRVRCINPDHDDKNPSMDIRNGYAYCYACGWTGDSIRVYMTLHGCTFPDAVRALNV